MPAPINVDEFLDLVRKSGVADEKRFEPHIGKLRDEGKLPPKPERAAGILVRDGLLTHFQAEQLLQGKWRRFTIGKYKVLERLGSGGMGQVYLCEHKLMRRRVAVKVLPTAKAAEESSLERFYREARAVAALDHANIVHAYDIDQDESLHFLVMEYVDGASLQEIVKKSGPLDPIRAAHYVYQTTQGLAHAHLAGLVHRDIKPANLLVDRNGVLKILDMGLARFFNDEDDMLTRKFDENVLGTADYLAPEQAVDSHEADTRADIYSLGATFYFLLTGRTPFEEGTVAQKLIWHQTRRPKAINTLRSDVPPEMIAIIDKMMEKEAENRYQHPLEVRDALRPWAVQPVPPPSQAEMPSLSPAAGAKSQIGEGGQPSFGKGPGSSSAKRQWQVSSAPPSPTPIPQARSPVPQPAPARPSTPLPKQQAPLPRPTAPPLASPPPAKSNPPPAAARGADATPLARGSQPVSPAVAPAAARGADATPLAGGSQPVEPAVAPVAPSPATQQVQVQQPELNQPWESLTDDLALEVTESSKQYETPRKKKAARETNSRSVIWVMLGICATAIVILGAVALVWVFVIAPSTSNQVGRMPLKVSDSKKLGEFRTIQQALRTAKPGDVIELWDQQHRENLIVDPQKGTTQVTIQAAPNKQVVWTSAGISSSAPLLQLNKAKFFHLKGDNIELEGNGKLSSLVQIMFQSAGLKIESAHLKGFTKYGIQITNCTGAKDNLVQLQNLQFTAADAEKSYAIYFNAIQKYFPSVNDHIAVSGCVFHNMPLSRAIGHNNKTDTGPDVRLPSGRSD